MATPEITIGGFPETTLLVTHGYGGVEPGPPGPSAITEVDLFKFTNELQQAVYISIFSDRRVPFVDEAPSEPNDRRGWWGDLLEEAQNIFIGSRLWTMLREKVITPDITDEIEIVVAESIQWLIDDGVASEFKITITVLTRDTFQIDVVIIKGDKYLTKFEAVWNRLKEGVY